MLLDTITFTGVDETTEFDKLLAISAENPQVEWGILVGSQTGMVYPAQNMIFPPLPLVLHTQRLAKKNEGRWALHLCGSFARNIFEKDNSPSGYYQYLGLLRLCHGFQRVQVNLHGDAFNPKDIEVRTHHLKTFIENVECEKVILQHRDSWDKVPMEHQKLEYLFDRSGGAGRAAFKEWPEVPEFDSGILHVRERVGYAGGIGPDTIDYAMQWLSYTTPYTRARVWFDMEGRIRTYGCLDLEKVQKVLARVDEWERYQNWQT